jgi:hypothetical protein
MEGGMIQIQEERLKKVCDNFSLLNEEQQDYILGILQALVFARNHRFEAADKSPEPVNSKTVSKPLVCHSGEK